MNYRRFGFYLVFGKLFSIKIVAVIFELEEFDFVFLQLGKSFLFKRYFSNERRSKCYEKSRYDTH